MLIWGTKPVKRRISVGEFYCPQCGSQQPYQRMWVRKHGHVYWIPLFGMGEPVEYVECGTCGGEFLPQVLERQPSGEDAFQKAFFVATVATMAAVARADGRVDESEVTAIQGVMEKLLGSAVDPSMVEAWVAESAEDPLAKAEFLLTTIRPNLSDEGREMLVRTALLVAIADGEMADAEMEAVQRVAAALQLSPAHLSGILGSIEA